MKNLRTILLTTVMLIAGLSLSAQKFGHLNSRLLLMEMPDIKAADTQIEEYSNELLAAGETMVKAFEANYKQYIDDANAGKLSALQSQKRESDLRTEQQSIKDYEVEIQNKLILRKEQLYAPLLEKVKLAIEKIGKDNGYTMIFDTSVAGAIVHAEQSEDILALVKQELGLQ